MKNKLMIISIIFILILTSAITVFASIYAVADHSVTLSADKNLVKAEETFTVTIKATSIDGINGIDTSYSYDTEKLQLISATVADNKFDALVVDNQITLMSNSSETIINADLYVLTFKVKEGIAAGNTAKIALAQTLLDTYAETNPTHTIPAQEIAITVIEEPKVEISKIEVTKVPTQKEYIKDTEQLNLTGGELTVTYTDNSTKTVSLTSEEVTVTGFNNKVEGTNTLTVNYGGKTTTFNVTIKVPVTPNPDPEPEPKVEISKIEVTKVPTQKEYIKDTEQLDLTGGELTVTYTDNTTASVSLTNKEVTVTGFDNTKEGINTLTVTYGGKTATFDVTIKAAAIPDPEPEPKVEISKIEVTKVPTQKEYIKDTEQLDLTGGELTVTYTDNSTKTVSLTSEEVTVTGFDNTKKGTNTLTVTYKEKTATFDVQIVLPDATVSDNEYDNAGMGTILIISIIIVTGILILMYAKTKKYKDII